MAQIHASKATLVSPEKEKVEQSRAPDKYDELTKWIVTRVDAWRQWRDSQYSADWLTYERLWRGVWSPNERLRDSERSKIITPALSEAVENGAAEIEEATFGRGSNYFDIQPYNNTLGTEDETQQGPPMGPMGMAQPEMGMPQPEMGMQPPVGPEQGMLPPVPEQISPKKQIPQNVEKVRGSLREDLGRTNFAASVAKCILNSGVFGLGVGEIVTKEVSIKTPAMPVATVEKLELGSLRSVSPRNFVYDPLAESVDDGLGVAIEENISKHVIQMAQQSGVFRKDIDLTELVGEPDPGLSGDQVNGAATPDLTDTIHQIRYYGLVPERLLYPQDASENVVDLYADKPRAEDKDDGKYCEAIVIIINKQVTLKAVKNPYMMGDRPVVIFPWDVVPGRLNGRGICEKGVHPQKVLDAEVRARLDALAYVTAPMMGMDANRMPRGFQFKFKPGSSVLTGGNPQEILFPFKFGELDANHWQNLTACMSMVQQATGSVDAAAMAQGMGDARSGAVSMALAPVIKRYKRTMTHFVDLFLMPALEKITYRNMQTMPERYPAVGLKFSANSTMGIMQREYETAQLTQVLAVLEPQTAEHRAILTGLVGNMSIPNREEVLELIRSGEDRERMAMAMSAMQQADPMQQQLQQATVELAIQEKVALIEEIKSKTQKNYAQAEEIGQSSEINAMQVATKGLYGLPADQQSAEFDRRWKMAQLALKMSDIDEKRADRASNERITEKQMRMSLVKDQIKQSADIEKERLRAMKQQKQPSA